MAKASKTRASKLPYQSTSQLTLEGFETPFAQHLSAKNRWVVLAHQIPWDQIVNVYEKQMRNGTFGASNINGRVIIGSLVIKHLCNLSDEDTLLHIQENMYMQYFIGYSGFSNEAPFDSSLFVEIRKRLGAEQVNAINERIYEISREKSNKPPDSPDAQAEQSGEGEIEGELTIATHAGRLLVDATVSPQDIAYPTDLNMLNDSREKSEELIDTLFNPLLHGNHKPRTYRKKARHAYLRTAQKKTKSKNEIRSALRKQLGYLKRNIKHIQNLLAHYQENPLDEKQKKYFEVIQEVYRQQKEMYDAQTHSIEKRIVSIHQPHVRPIVRGKERSKVEFGAKINLSLVNGFSFLDHLSWEAYNEGTLLLDSIEHYKRRHGFFPKEVLADKIYCNRENRKQLKLLDIMLIAKPLGRPSAVNREHVRPGERNPIEGKFGQAKTAYGLDRIKARLSNTSESWIASIIMVLNLVKLAGQVPLTLIRKLFNLVTELLQPKKVECLLIQ